MGNKFIEPIIEKNIGFARGSKKVEYYKEC
jgi:hypothetical protein